MEIDDAVVSEEVIALVLWGWGVGTPGMDMVAIHTSLVRRSSEALEGRKSLRFEANFIVLLWAFFVFLCAR